MDRVLDPRERSQRWRTSQDPPLGQSSGAPARSSVDQPGAAGRYGDGARRAAVVLIVGCALIGWLAATRLAAHHPSARVGGTRASRGEPRSPEQFVVTRLPFKLPVALQDTAGVPLGSGRAALLGGLNTADTSTAAVSVLDAHGVTASASLPEAQHDAQGVMLDGRAYVFGGGSSAPTTTSSPTTQTPTA